ncbi:MAG: Lrp/AsnC family transcriptional regulator [Alphaproteobacteria bacterium]|nr:Lrp/AsnC family transcriptional regulator [Alphaproteobacteria bacterium]
MAKYQKNITIKENKPFAFDVHDKKILNILQENNQITNVELAERIGLSPPPCLRRVKQLRDEGIITHDVSVVDPHKVGRNFIVFLNVSLKKQREDLLENFERKMLQHEEVMQCYFVSGDFDYFLVIMVSDVQAYHDFVRRTFANDHNIKMFRSSFALNRVKYSTKIAL